jgi:hypothetical protein
MTVVLSGVAADSTNAAVAPVYDDGGFEYVPIPEKTSATAETATYGTWPLRGRPGVAADLFDRIVPDPGGQGESGAAIREGDRIRDWPLHHDPNFDALAYGEHDRSNYLSALGRLDPGDVVGFYAGLRDTAGRAHRYLIGYFTVDRLDVVAADATPARKRAALAAHPDNAHAKRATDGVPYLDDERLALIAGRDPGGLFAADPVRLSTFRPANGHYYLDEAVRDRFRVIEGSDWMTIKPAYVCDLEADTFVDLVGVPGQRGGSGACRP